MCYNSKILTLKGQLKNKTALGNIGDFYENEIATNCGYCHSCRLKKRRDWIVRNHFENKTNPISYVFTLTYKETPTFLKYEDLQKFHKNLRYHGYSFRYFAVGEYGEKHGRPHYHSSYYGMKPISDLVVSEYKSNGYHVYRSESIEKIWKHGYCFIQEADGDSNRIAYTTLYHTKNQQLNAKRIFGLAKNEKQFDKEREFQKFLNTIKEKNLFSSSLGFDNFLPYYEKYRENGGQVWIDGFAYQIPTSWLKKLILGGDKWALDHYKEIIENMPGACETVKLNRIKCQLYEQSLRKFDDLSKIDQKLF